MNETDKGKLQRLHTQLKRYGIDGLSTDDIYWLFELAMRQEEMLDFVNNEQGRLMHRLAAQTSQVFRGV